MRELNRKRLIIKVKDRKRFLQNVFPLPSDILSVAYPCDDPGVTGCECPRRESSSFAECDIKFRNRWRLLLKSNSDENSIKVIKQMNIPDIYNQSYKYKLSIKA